MKVQKGLLQASSPAYILKLIWFWEEMREMNALIQRVIVDFKGMKQLLMLALLRVLVMLSLKIMKQLSARLARNFWSFLCIWNRRKLGRGAFALQDEQEDGVEDVYFKRCQNHFSESLERQDFGRLV